MDATPNHAGLVQARVPDDERGRLLAAIDELVAAHGSADEPNFLRVAPGLGHLLPRVVRDRVLDMRYGERSAVLVVRNGPVDDDPGPTPGHWAGRPAGGTVRHDVWLVLLAAQLGDPVCWSTLQDGRLLNDILPIRGEEDQQTGHGSEAELDFHVEDAFHDNRCDMLALLALRNDDAVPTTVAAIDALDLDALDLDVLFAPRYRIHPDPEHLRDSARPASVVARVRPVLDGPRHAPYLRVDPAYTEPLPGDERARKAFVALCTQLSERLVDVTLSRGDVLLLDNHRAVHGRRRFVPRYDGTDRWLRKVGSVRDLRRCRSHRATADGRVLAPFSFAPVPLPA